MKLSVITPTHNRMALLEQLLRSLEVQTYTDFEVVVAVDGSTDGTLTLLEAMKRKNLLMVETVVLNGVGRATARNQAIQKATGEVLIFLDDDLSLNPDVLARHAAFHQMFKNAVAVGAVRFPDQVTRFSTHPDWMNFSGCNCSVTRDIVQKLGGFDQKLGYGGEDLEFGYRLKKVGWLYKALANVEVFHHGNRIPDTEKGYSAGFQAVRIAQKHGETVALQLGVHPSLLAAKRLVLNPVGDFLLRSRADYAFERAYLQGAQAAWAESKVAE